MSSDTSEQPSRNPERIEQEAVAWFTRMHGEPSAGDRRNFDRWRTADPENERAYGKVAQSYAATDGLNYKAAASDAEALKSYLAVIHAGRKRRARMANAASAAGIALLCGLSFFAWRDHPNLIQNLSADHYTARAERRTVTLADGSSVTLDADSAITQDISAHERRVRLLRGTAFFDVVKSDVPFVVEAGDGETRVTGTAFSVETSGEGATIALARGSVSVSGKAGSGTALLSPGQSVSYGIDGIGPVGNVPVDDILSWRDGWLVFDQAPLADVVGHINRYRPGRIVIAGSELAARKVSGNLPLDKPDSALASLQATVGFRLTRLGSNLVVIGP